MIIKIININEIKPYKNNPRFNQDGVPHLKRSIERFGMRWPIILDKNNVVVAGHTRLMAIKELMEDYKDVEPPENIKEILKGNIPYLDTENLPDRLIKEFRIADNKTAELSTWDREKLIIEVEEMDEVVGFEPEDLDYMKNYDNKEKLKEMVGYDPDERKRNKENYPAPENTKQERMIECPHCKEKFVIEY